MIDNQKHPDNGSLEEHPKPHQHRDQFETYGEDDDGATKSLGERDDEIVSDISEGAQIEEDSPEVKARRDEAESIGSQDPEQ